MLSDTDVPRWLELITVAQAAELVIRYFGARPDSGCTLAEKVGNLRFALSFADPSLERATMMAMVNLVQSHEQLSGPVSPSQHAHLITLIEKRLPADSQIRIDYFLRRGARAHPRETWKDAMIHFHRCISDVRASMKKNESYGDPARVYDFHPDSLRHLPPRRVASKATSSAPTPLVRRSEVATPAPPRDPVCCPSCGHYGHGRPTCPHRWQSDANNDPTLSWTDSYLGRKWLSYGRHQYEATSSSLVRRSDTINHHGLAQRSPIAQGSTKQARFNDRPLQSRDTDDRGRDDRRKPGKTHYQPVPRCKSPPISAPVSAPLLSPPPDDYLQVTIFLDQTGNRKATAPLQLPRPRRTVEKGALLDTGSLACRNPTSGRRPEQLRPSP
jgi:hypothetical protein